MRSKLLALSKEVQNSKINNLYKPSKRINSTRYYRSKGDDFDQYLPVVGIIQDSTGNAIKDANVSIEGLHESMDLNKVSHSIYQGNSTTNEKGEFYLALKYHSYKKVDLIANCYVKIKISHSGQEMKTNVRIKGAVDYKKLIGAIFPEAGLGSILKVLKIPNPGALLSTNFIGAVAITNPIKFNATSTSQSLSGAKFQTETVKLISASNNAIAMSPTDFPSPATIMSHYPTPSEYCSYADNECAIRMSIAFQGAGVDITGSSKFRKTHVHGGSNIVHQPSAAALADWLHHAIKYPRKYDKGVGQKYTQSEFIDKEGIIYFVHPGERGGTGPGHFDVISGGKIGSGFYDNQKIWFWEYSGGQYI